MNTNTSATALAAEHQLTASEQEQARVFLQQTRSGMIGAAKGLSGAQWKFAAGPECWSIAAIVEHVIFVCDLVAGPLFSQLATAPAPAADRDCAHVDAIIIHQFPNRLAKFPAPERSHPTGERFASPAEAIGALGKVYAELGQRLETPDLRLHALDAPPLKAISKGAYQTMDGYQWILAAAAHCERHTKQILEVKADTNFPES